MTVALRPLAKLSEDVAELQQQRVTFVTATVVAVSGVDSTFTVEFSGGERLAGIGAPPHFLPAVGDEVLLERSGALPIYQPGRVAEGAIGDTELAGYVTQNITTAQATADGKNAFFFSPNAPTAATPGNAADDSWMQRDNASRVITGSWEWDGAAWQPFTYGNEVLNSLTVGKLVGGTGTFDLIVGGRLTTAATGQRTELNPLGLQGFNAAGTLTINLDGVKNLITGEIRSEQSGQRIVINPGGAAPSRMDFYPSTGSEFASIEAQTVGGQAAVAISANNAQDTGQSGVLLVRRSFAHMFYGPKDLSGTPQGIYVDYSTVRTNSQIVDLQITPGLNTAGGARIAMGIKGVAATQLNVWATGANHPWMAAVNQDSGIFFGPGLAHIVGNDGFNHRDLQVNVLHYGSLAAASSEKIKTDVVDAASVIDVRAAFKRARAKQYKVPSRAVTGRAGDERTGPVLGRPAPTQVGLIAEHMPAAVQVTTPAHRVGDADVLGYDLNGAVALAWDGVGMALDAIEGLRAEVAALRLVTPRGTT